MLTLTMRQTCADDMSTIQKTFQKFNILEFSNDSWNHCQNCIKLSTTMPSIESVICEMGFEFQEC